MFSEIGIEKLEPDLVVMDEFQRFKNLLDTDENDETGMLARKFFARVGVKMLLLSATPYKMYSTLDEIEEENADEHYREFLKVTDFLNEPNCEKGVFNGYFCRVDDERHRRKRAVQAYLQDRKESGKRYCRYNRRQLGQTIAYRV